MIMELTLDRRKSLGSKDRICIRLWVFKFVINNDGDFGVCVEGYRPNDATETILRNWHSTIIKERLTSTLLITRSGSTYELRGNMDETLATQYGYPTSLTDMFKCGFPPDWESVLREYYDSVRSVYTYNMNSRLWVAPYKMFSECDSTTVRSVTRNKDKTLEVGKCRGKGISLENNDRTDAYVDVSFGSENKSKSNSVDCVTGKEIALCSSMPSESTSIVKVFSDFKIPTSSHLKKSYQQKNLKGLHSRGQIISLREWSIRFVPIEPRIPKLTYPPFVILGRRESSVAQWQTSVIMDVVNGRFCSTISTTYYLEGDMQIMDAAEVGFPKYFVGNFLRGFPDDWKFQLNYLYRTFFGHTDIPYESGEEVSLHKLTRKTQRNINMNNNQIMSGNNTQSDVMNCSEARSEFDTEYSTYEKTPEYTKFQNGGSCTETENRMNHWEFLDERRQEPPSKKSKSTSNLLGKSDNSINSCRAVVVRKYSEGLSRRNDVHLSRSGRCVRAPLAQWAGQRVRYDACGNAIGIQDVNTDTIHCKGAVNTLALAEHYGISPARNNQQLESYSHIPTLAVDSSGRKKTTQLNALVSYSDYSSEDEENNAFWQTLRDGHYSDNDSPLHKYGTTRIRRIDSENSEEERELRREKRKLRKDARRLAQRERELRERERRLMESIAKKRKSKQKFAKNKTQEVYQSSDNCNDENEVGDSTDTEVESDGRNWNAGKTSKSLRQMSRKKKSAVIEIETNSEKEIDKSRNAKTKKKEKPWTKGEVNRLKLALAAINVRTVDDWNKISRSLGNQRSPESCMQAAISKLKWEVPVEESNKQDENICENDAVTARMGTVAHRVQTNQITRKFMMGAGSQEDDFFRFNGQDEADALPDVAEFDANDSLLSAIRTPVVLNHGNKGANRRPFIAEVMEDDTPLRDQSGHQRGMSSPALFDSAQREQQDRYVHHLLQNKSIAPNSTRFGNSTFFNSTYIRKKNNYESFARQLDNLKNERVRRKRNEYDSELSSIDDMDEELEDSC